MDGGYPGILTAEDIERAMPIIRQAHAAAR